MLCQNKQDYKTKLNVINHYHVNQTKNLENQRRKCESWTEKDDWFGP